ncbi:hypothetical protein LCI18_013085 [Fusarium solani-melongenae]|uniref:Uncharacterized protein n=1 Tax=Fusarium solani subsp. cucurbitae TaxID=2747967 RepID=A0ACD3ZLR3_FUSSC|nr:hypothetical protein LCI18_013085 [Fusarium solani-melongenae]
MFHVPLDPAPTLREKEIHAKMLDAARDRDMPRLRQELQRWHMLKGEELRPPGRTGLRWPKIIHREFVSVAREMANEGNSEVIGYLLNMGMMFQTDVLLRAARRCHWGVIKVHMDCGWWIDGYLNSDSEPPLLGRLIHKEECVRGLLELGANPKAMYVDDSYDIPHLAGKAASPSVIQLLQEYGVDFKETNAFHEATHREGDLQIDTMTYLLDEIGVPINKLTFPFQMEVSCTWIGCCCGTALHCAVKTRNIEKVEFLVGRGADPNVKDEGGKSPLDWAKEKGFGDAVRVLREINSGLAYPTQ